VRRLVHYRCPCKIRKRVLERGDDAGFRDGQRRRLGSGFWRLGLGLRHGASRDRSRRHCIHRHIVTSTPSQLSPSLLTRSTGAVHTSAKGQWRNDVRVATAILLVHALHCRVAQHSRLIPLSMSPNSDESGKQSLYPDCDPDRHQNLIICSSAHYQPSLNISCKCVWKFLHKVANKQTEKETDKVDKHRQKHNLPWQR